MNAELITYFTGEKNGALLLVFMAIVSITGSYLLWHSKSAFVAMAWPLVILGAFELAVGAAVASRTPAQVQQLERGIATDKRITVSKELERMERVNRNFAIVKKVEVAFIVIGLIGAIAFPLGSTWSAVGLGLLLQSTALLVFDSFAHDRANTYVQWLQSI